MAWPIPQYETLEINRAGRILVATDASAEDLAWAQRVLGNWRACHGYPINTFQATLRTKLKRIDPKALVAQRLKRAPSIVDKLRRFDSMRLAQMQDIGGLRAVVGNIATVRNLDRDYRGSRFKHELVNRKDYIAEPKTDGYRSIHLVFRYRSDLAPAYDGLHIELQLRTRLQHAWATAVETMSTFLGQALKSRQGERRWLAFFEVTGSAFAHIERSPLVPGYDHLTRPETYAQVASAEAELEVLDKLRGFSIAMDAITTDKRRASYHLVELDSERKTVTTRGYSREMLDEAMRDYAVAEARLNAGEKIEAVLVSAGPIELLRRAYPNYFLDTQDFIRRVENIIGETPGGAANKTLRRTPARGRS
jgi:putative GTP pyrophosphokinase